MSTVIHQRVDAARNGHNPTVICRTRTGWAVMKDVQLPRGSCFLLPDPVVAELTDMDPKTRGDFLADMADLGAALLAVTSAVRINYHILANTEPALRAHVVPRYADEPADMQRRPTCFYDTTGAPRFDAAADAPLMRTIADQMRRLGAAR